MTPRLIDNPHGPIAQPLIADFIRHRSTVATVSKPPTVTIHCGRHCLLHPTIIRLANCDELQMFPVAEVAEWTDGAVFNTFINQIPISMTVKV